MSATVEITGSLVRKTIHRAFSDVFQRLLGRRLTAVGVTEMSGRDDLHPPFAGPGSAADTVVVGSVGFQGDINGLLYLYLDEALARLATGRLCRKSEDGLVVPDDEVANDTVGEITRLTAGGFSVGLHEAGCLCVPTLPSILRGSNFSIEPVSTVIRFDYRFEPAGPQAALDLLFKTRD